MGRAAKNYPWELQERAVLMVRDVRADYGSEWAALEAMATKLGIGSAETLRKWSRRGGGRRATFCGGQDDHHLHRRRELTEPCGGGECGQGMQLTSDLTGVDLSALLRRLGGAASGAVTPGSNGNSASVTPPVKSATPAVGSRPAETATTAGSE